MLSAVVRDVKALEGMVLWQTFVQKAEGERAAMVDKLLQHAGAMLDRVIETFPTYTLHNRVHAENVVARMGDLLGTRVDDLTALEAAMLLLAAYYHDIGMVFDEHERQALAEEEFFAHFLDEHPEAYEEMNTQQRRHGQ